MRAESVKSVNRFVVMQKQEIIRFVERTDYYAIGIRWEFQAFLEGGAIFFWIAVAIQDLILSGLNAVLSSYNERRKSVVTRFAAVILVSRTE